MNILVRRNLVYHGHLFCIESWIYYNQKADDHELCLVAYITGYHVELSGTKDTLLSKSQLLVEGPTEKNNDFQGLVIYIKFE